MTSIDHGDDHCDTLAHASRLLVKVAQVVRRGERIAEAGSRTVNRQPLHFEVRYKSIAQNPVRFSQNAAS
jgi:murein DD-endopeptidase MepM/ murein hydrolase activator NlpD